jgi:putative ABC transport system permease protein
LTCHNVSSDLKSAWEKQPDFTPKEALAEPPYSVNPIDLMQPLTQDVRFSLRLIRKKPGMTFLVVAALVLGIGLNTAIFSVVNAVLLRPLPIFQPDRVVWLHSKVNQTGATLGTSFPDYLDWKNQSRSFEAVTALYAVSFTLSGSGPAEHLKATAISASGFKVWGVSTVLGRDFTEADDQPGANRVAILTYAFWQRKFGGDPNILGKSLALDDQTYTIIGILQPTPVDVLGYPDLYVANGPLLNQHIMERDTRYFFPVGRLKPDVTYEQAQAEMDTIAARLASEYPKTNKDMGIRVQSVVQQLTAGGRRPLLLLILASSLIFLLATINVMTVFWGNTVERRQELNVRLALGSTRSSLLRQLFIQALLYAVIGASFGLLFAKLGLASFLRRFPAAVLRFEETTIDWRVVFLTMGMALVASLAATVAPAIYAFRVRTDTELKGEWSSMAPAKYRIFGRAGLILFEVALASALSVVSGLLIKSLYEVEKIDLGFKPNSVFSFQVNLPPTRYNDPAKQSAFYKLAVNKLSNLPGMQTSSAISSLPLTTQGQANTLEIEGESPLAGQHLLVEDESILPGFFRTMRLPLLQGRDFTDADHAGTPAVIIVDEILAAKLWPGQNALGKHLRMSTQRGGSVRSLEVIGIVREIKHFGPERPARWMQVYVPQYQDPTPMLSFVVNTPLPEATVRTAAEKTLHELDKDLPVENFQTMDAYLDTYLSGRKVSLLLLSGFAATGIVLGAIGIYGVVANSVIQRRREIAIRMAVGATHASTMVLITRLGLLATLTGLAIGSLAVISLTRLLASMLYGVSTLDPTIYLLTAATLILLALIASAVPAMRLLRFNIQEILRQ